jgi:hypothetical protein
MPGFARCYQVAWTRQLRCCTDLHPCREASDRLMQPEALQIQVIEIE